MPYPNIRAEMERHDLTMKELARNLGLSTNNIRFKLSGRREFTLSEIECIANMFGCSLQQFPIKMIVARFKKRLSGGFF